MGWLVLAIFSCGIIAVLAGAFSLRVRHPWRAVLWIVGFATGTCFAVPVFMVSLSWLLFAKYPETLSQARDIMEAHVSELAALHDIVEAHPALCYAGPHVPEEGSACLGDTKAAVRDPAYAADFKKATAILAAVHGYDMGLSRPGNANKLTSISFIMYEPGIFDTDGSIVGIWLAPDQKIGDYGFYYCQPTRARGWYACRVDD